MSAPLLPLLRIQHDWYLDVSKDNDPSNKATFWVSYTRENGKTLYGNVNATRSGKSLQLDCGESKDFRVHSFNSQNRSIIQLVSPDNTIFSYQAASQTFSPTAQPINCLNISPGGELGVCGGNEGSLQIFATSDGSILRQLTGHVGDILTCRFFPSGQVVLTGGTDVQLKIWSATEGNCAAVCKGHSGGILGTAIVDRGRNIISCSRDGTARLWECASQATIAILAQETKPINDCCLCSTPSPLPSDRQMDPREVGTDGKLVLLACDSGELLGVDMRSQKEAFRVQCGSPVESCFALSDTTYLAGTRNGIVHQYSASNMRTTSPITKLDFGTSPVEYTAGTGEGICFVWNTQTQQCTKDLSGPDHHPITGVSTNQGTIYTASRDGCIRKYTN